MDSRRKRAGTSKVDGGSVPSSPPPFYYQTPFSDNATPSSSSSGRRQAKTRTVTSPNRFMALPAPSRASSRANAKGLWVKSDGSPKFSPLPPPYNQRSAPPLVINDSSEGGQHSVTATESREGGIDSSEDGHVGRYISPTAVFSRNFQKEKLCRFQGLIDQPNTELAALRKLSWGGIPSPTRASVWKLLLGYLPLNLARREAALQRKRNEYFECIPRYLSKERDEYEEGIYRQISIDVPRTNPGIPLFQKELVHVIMQRILYVWAVRHPATSYVQGINDLAAPFFIVFLNEHVEDVMNCDPATLDPALIRDIEADVYWSVTKLLDGIQDRYTFAQPGIQRDIVRLQELVHRLDEPLFDHLKQIGVDFLQFAFRWMNCLLLRELSLELVVRMWDTYASEEDGFSVFHLYVCAAFLVRWSKELRHRDFQEAMLFLQNVPTDDWGEREVEELMAQGYTYKMLFLSSPSHLK